MKMTRDRETCEKRRRHVRRDSNEDDKRLGDMREETEMKMTRDWETCEKRRRDM